MKHLGKKDLAPPEEETGKEAAELKGTAPAAADATATESTEANTEAKSAPVSTEAPQLEEPTPVEPIKLSEVGYLAAVTTTSTSG